MTSMRRQMYRFTEYTIWFIIYAAEICFVSKGLSCIQTYGKTYSSSIEMELNKKVETDYTVDQSIHITSTVKLVSFMGIYVALVVLKALSAAILNFFTRKMALFGRKNFNMATALHLQRK